MKKLLSVFLSLVVLVSLTACGQPEEKITIEPQISQMKSICKLAVMECYYHDVAKYTEKDAAGMLWWKKDKRFWIEYSGVVKLGIDVSLVNIEVEDSQITITLPPAEVQGCTVDSSSLTKESYIVDQSSANIKAEDEILAFKEAQKMLEENAASDTTLLAEAQQRAQTLLEDYVTNIGNAVGKEYTINWVYLDEKQPQTESSADQITSSLPPASSSSQN